MDESVNLKITYHEILEVLKKENILLESKKANESLVKYLSSDSRDIKKDTLFFCKGAHYKKEYLNQAIEKGSNMYISEVKYDVQNISYFIVNDIKKAMAVVAHKFYHYSFKNIETIGITGTKGKTTTTYFLKNILDEYLNSKTAIISTIETYTGMRREDSHLTTPEAIDLQKFFYEIAKSNIKYLTMEVTSQAYKVDRVYNVNFKNGIFLNISEDHISDVEHPNYEDYLNCKLQLLKNADNLVINADTNEFDIIMNACRNKTVTLFGTDNRADYYYKNIVKEQHGFSFDVINEQQGYINNFKIAMQGRFNIENAMAAITMAKTLGIDDNSISNGLLKTQVQGRMNVFDKKGITVIVDYAHNSLSFSKLFESIKLDYQGRRIICVGGAPGGKAYKRRRDFGVIVGDNSDYIYLTAEDPQFEDVKDICMEINEYIEENTKCEIIEDRKDAVEKAINNAEKGDVIVLLAKGAETYQKVKGLFVPYESDLAITKRMLGI